MFYVLLNVFVRGGVSLFCYVNVLLFNCLIGGGTGGSDIDSSAINFG